MAVTRGVSGNVHIRKDLKKKKEVERMNLLYKSTRSADKTVTASEAILKGLADDGGLFVPEDCNETVPDRFYRGRIKTLY